MPIQIGNVSATLFVDTENACSILDRSLATLVTTSHMDKREQQTTTANIFQRGIFYRR